jgi:hypothetical protein
LVRFDVNSYGNKPADMESGFDELRIIGQGLSNSRVVPWLSLQTRNGRITTKRVPTSGPESIALGLGGEVLGDSAGLEPEEAPARLKLEVA